MMMRPKNRLRLISFLILLASVSLACELPINIHNYGRRPRPTPTPEDLDSPQAAEPWDIHQCNAIREVNISLTEFEEFQPEQEQGAVECHYGHEITNLDGVRIIYHKYFHYGNTVPEDREDGWISKGFAPTLESYTLRSSLTDYPNSTPVRWESVLLTIAVIYDRPECAWITDGGIHFDVLYIAEEEPVMCPCTLLTPEHLPDITEGLVVD